MIIFQLIPKLYTVKNLKWVELLEDIPHPVVLNKWLSMNPTIQKHVNYLNKFTFVLTPKQFLLLVLAVIPRHAKAPFCKYIKKEDSEEKYIEIWEKIQHVGNYSDNDMKYIKKYLNIESNILYWFKGLGLDKKTWTKYNLNFDENKGNIIKGKSGLDLFM